MRNWIPGAIATCRFELFRSFSLHRLGVMAVLMLFPPGILWLLLVGAANRMAGAEIIKYVLFVMIFLVALVTLLSLLLWATPVVAGELEGKTWSFIAMRPGGRIANFLGKFLTSALVSFSIAFVALTLCTLIANASGTLGNEQAAWGKWAKLCAIFSIASVAYSAVLSAIGTLFIKRAMVVGAAFLLAWEGMLSLVPAVVSRLTMSYHLRRLGEIWLGWFLPDSKIEYELLFGKPGPVWMHISAISLVALIGLLVGLFVIVNRQYISGEE